MLGQRHIWPRTEGIGSQQGWNRGEVASRVRKVKNLRRQDGAGLTSFFIFSEKGSHSTVQVETYHMTAWLPIHRNPPASVLGYGCEPSFCLFVFSVLLREPRALSLLDKGCTTELHPQSL